VPAVTEVIVLNGGSSSGKSSLAHSLQGFLPDAWAALGVDDLLASLAPSLVSGALPRAGRPPLIAFGTDGAVHVDPAWRPVEAAWHMGVAAMARGGHGQGRPWRDPRGGTDRRCDGLTALPDAPAGLLVLWVGSAATRPSLPPARRPGPTQSPGSLAWRRRKPPEFTVVSAMTWSWGHHRHVGHRVRPGRAGPHGELLSSLALRSAADPLLRWAFPRIGRADAGGVEASGVAGSQPRL
jgi:energy-coupling factor transporter ATP-binding protein EcfA2